tara:strand:+ start:399 stop:908 length:510 start_codon:yes stop_codon:yes gene_type:complete
MNIFILTLVIFVIFWIFFNWFIKTSSKKISNVIRTTFILSSIILALLMVFVGRYLFSLPFLMLILPMIKTKAGLSLLQLIRIWSLLRVLKKYRGFKFNNFNQFQNTQNMSIEEACDILNLDLKKKFTKEEVDKNYKNIMKKIHPDVSPELTKLATIVNQAKEIVMKHIT